MIGQLENNQSTPPKSEASLDLGLFGKFSGSTYSQQDVQDSLSQNTPPKTPSRKELAGRFMSEDISCADSLSSPTVSIWKQYDQEALSFFQSKEATPITITPDDYSQNSLGYSNDGEFHQNKVRKLLLQRKQSFTQSAKKESDMPVPKAVATQTGTAC